ncbi:hypothetical protein KFK09_028740 [Dendrobium nobile]|uniref:Uncharacterized protein n=1 Tax=Dendrobium nobile TaxID=94219 RepID=A0A8T3A3W9_DENNO|nr:hypothetical protein KFK09_028740 [Dendrobium nobile]
MKFELDSIQFFPYLDFGNYGNFGAHSNLNFRNLKNKVGDDVEVSYENSNLI